MSTLYTNVIQILTGNLASGNAAAVAIFGEGNEQMFTDDKAMRLTKSGQQAWASESVATQEERERAEQIGGSGLTIRCGERDIQYKLRAWVESQGFTVTEAG